jgi:hypothetical protein
MAEDDVADPEASLPSVAMVSVDGGRLQIQSGSASEPTRSGHWRESKVAVLETHRSEVHQADPDPHLPLCFLDLKRAMEKVGDLGHALPVGLEFAGQTPPSGPDRASEEERDRKSRPGRPSVWCAASWPAAGAPTNSDR